MIDLLLRVFADCLNDCLIGECTCVNLQQSLLSDDNAPVTSSFAPADNNDEVTDVDDGDGSRTLICTYLTDTDAAAAAAAVDDQDDDIVSRNLQKRQSVESLS